MPHGKEINEIREIALMILLSILGRLGRRQISNYLKIGEGVTKRIVRNLDNQGLVDIKRGGGSLSRKGLENLRDKLSKFKIVSVKILDVEEVCPNCKGVGFLLRKLSLCKLVEIRDEAVRGGARGALIIRVEEGKLTLPPDLGYLEDYFPLLANEIKENFEISEGDVIILAFSENIGDAIIGGLKASILAGRV